MIALSDLHSNGNILLRTMLKLIAQDELTEFWVMTVDAYVGA